MFTPLLSPFSIGLIPLGSPKYIPPVNSLTIIISNPDTISGLRLEASTNCLKQIAGLRLANSFSSFLNFKSALSGLLEGLDDIDLSLEKEEKISSFENQIKKNKPWIN